MKKFLIIIIVFIAISAFLLFKQKENNVEILTLNTYSSGELGLEFEYQTGPQGYVLEEMIPTDTIDHLRTIIIFRTEDKERIDMGDIPEGGEGPPTITVSVFKNSQNMQALNWAKDNIQNSLINLQMTESVDVMVGGENAISYMSDGLYSSEIIIVPHGGNIYVFNGQYLDPESDLKKDFAPLIDSVRFIPKL